MGLVGENGAGKSTLVRIIAAFDSGFTGTYLLRGNEMRFSGPAAAEQAGIAIAQQELSLIPAMSVGENVFLSGDGVPTFASRARLARMATPYLEQVGLGHVNPHRTTSRLSIGEQHLVEVARLLAHDPQILILDEPTAALGETDSIRILDMVEGISSKREIVQAWTHRMRYFLSHDAQFLVAAYLG